MNSDIIKEMMQLWICLDIGSVKKKKPFCSFRLDESDELYKELCKEYKDYLPLHVAKLQALDSDKVKKCFFFNFLDFWSFLC